MALLQFNENKDKALSLVPNPQVTLNTGCSTQGERDAGTVGCGGLKAAAVNMGRSLHAGLLTPHTLDSLTLGKHLGAIWGRNAGSQGALILRIPLFLKHLWALMEWNKDALAGTDEVIKKQEQNGGVIKVPPQSWHAILGYNHPWG